MRHYRLLILISFTLILSLSALVQAKEIIGYYPRWQWHDRADLVNPETIPYDKLTILTYAFFDPQTDGSIGSNDPLADSQLLEGERSLITLAHQNNTRTIASIGGWKGSFNFPELAANSDTRQRFADACIGLIERYGFDGIDIDWEWPGYQPHNGTVQDRENFTRLLQ